MSTFVKGGGVNTPFGRNEFLRSNQDVKTESYTLAASTVPARTIDGATGQKILQPGTVLAKITSGPEAGKVGPFKRQAVSSEVQSVGVVGATAGSFTLSFDGETTAAIAWNANAAAVQAALNALSNVDAGDIVVTGGPANTTAFTLTFGGQYAGENVAQTTVDGAGLTGGAVTNTTTTDGGTAGAGATDGRGDAANIVGLNQTFLPWQLIERDVEVAAVYECTAVQAWCIELNSSDAEIALTNTTADAMRGVKGLDILFK